MTLAEFAKCFGKITRNRVNVCIKQHLCFSYLHYSLSHRCCITFLSEITYNYFKAHITDNKEVKIERKCNKTFLSAV